MSPRRFLTAAILSASLVASTLAFAATPTPPPTPTPTPAPFPRALWVYNNPSPQWQQKGDYADLATCQTKLAAEKLVAPQFGGCYRVGVYPGDLHEHYENDDPPLVKSMDDGD
jgi:hypothetical protein